MKSHEAVLSWAGNPDELEVLKASIEIDDPDSFDIIILEDKMEIMSRWYLSHHHLVQV